MNWRLNNLSRSFLSQRYRFYQPKTPADGDPWLLLGHFRRAQELRPANLDEDVSAHRGGISSSRWGYAREISAGLPRVSRGAYTNTEGKKKPRKKKEKKTRTAPMREHEGATHPEDWSKRSESGAIYMGAPPQILVSFLSGLFAHARAEDITVAI